MGYACALPRSILKMRVRIVVQGQFSTVCIIIHLGAQARGGSIMTEGDEDDPLEKIMIVFAVSIDSIFKFHAPRARRDMHACARHSTCD